MLSERCETCRHWLPPGERETWRAPVTVWQKAGETDEEFNARSAAIDLSFGQCKGVAENPDDVEMPLLACVTDASQYMASLWTTAEFGCVLHEPKDDV